MRGEEKMKKKLLITVTAILMMVFTACSSGKDDSTSNKGGENAGSGETTLLIAADQDPSGLDPHTTTAHSSHRIMGKIYEGLLDLDEDRNFVGQLAEDWEQVDDTTYTFKLRENVIFHNGREMTADDVKYSFERILDPDTGAISRSYFDVVEEINVLDTYEIEFKLSKPYAPFLSY